MMSDIPPTLHDKLKPLFFKKDMYSDELCTNGKEIRKIQLELMKMDEVSEEAGCPRGAGLAEQALACDLALRRSQRLMEETTDLTAKLRALNREIDGVLTQEMVGTAGCPERAASAEQVFEGNLRVGGERA